jgi:glycosyltransferase involved in cell wall biosynthesis
MKLSILIATYRRPERLRTTLESIAAQKLAASDTMELIVVDGASGEEFSPKIQAAFDEVSVANSHLIVLPANKGLSYSRNQGLAKAKGDAVIIIDDDIVLEENFVAETAAAFRAHPNASCIVGNLCPYRDDVFSRFWFHYYSAVYNREGEGDFYRIYRVPGGCAAYRSRLLESFMPVFDPALPSKEDLDLYIRLRSRSIPVFKNDRMVAYHNFRSSLWSLMKQRAWYQQGEEAIRRKYPPSVFAEVAREVTWPPKKLRFLHINLLCLVAERLYSIRRKVRALAGAEENK